MIEPAIFNLLRASVDEVLEKMFFIPPAGDLPSGSALLPELVARLTFEGDPSGGLSVHITTSAARSIAADFLGQEAADLSEAQIGEVVCELANMICGSVLSRISPNTLFNLSSPQIVVPGEPLEVCGQVVLAAPLDGGVLTVILNTETVVCLSAEKSAS